MVFVNIPVGGQVKNVQKVKMWITYQSHLRHLLSRSPAQVWLSEQGHVQQVG